MRRTALRHSTTNVTVILSDTVVGGGVVDRLVDVVTVVTRRVVLVTRLVVVLAVRLAGDCVVVPDVDVPDEVSSVAVLSAGSSLSVSLSDAPYKTGVLEEVSEGESDVLNVGSARLLVAGSTLSITGGAHATQLMTSRQARTKTTRRSVVSVFCLLYFNISIIYRDAWQDSRKACARPA